MKYLVINRITRCKVEVEASSTVGAVTQTPWRWEICEVRMMGKEGEDVRVSDGRGEMPELRPASVVGGVKP